MLIDIDPAEIELAELLNLRQQSYHELFKELDESFGDIEYIAHGALYFLKELKEAIEDGDLETDSDQVKSILELVRSMHRTHNSFFKGKS